MTEPICYGTSSPCIPYPGLCPLALSAPSAPLGAEYERLDATQRYCVSVPYHAPYVWCILCLRLMALSARPITTNHGDFCPLPLIFIILIFITLLLFFFEEAGKGAKKNITASDHYHFIFLEMTQNDLGSSSNDRNGKNFVLRNLVTIAVVVALVFCAALLGAAPLQPGLVSGASGNTTPSQLHESPKRTSLVNSVLAAILPSDWFGGADDCPSFRDSDLVAPEAVALLQPLSATSSAAQSQQLNSPHDETLCVLVGSRASDGVRTITTLYSLLNARPRVRIFLFPHAFVYPSDEPRAGSSENVTGWMEVQQRYLEQVLRDGAAPPDRTSVVPIAEVSRYYDGVSSLPIQQRMRKVQVAITQTALLHALEQKGCGFFTLTAAGSYFTEKFSLRYWDTTGIEVYGHLLCGDGTGSHPEYRRVPCHRHLYVLPSSGVIIPFRLLSDGSVRLIETTDESTKLLTCLRYSFTQWLINASVIGSPPPLHRATPQKRLTMFEDDNTLDEGLRRVSDSVAASKSASTMTNVCVISQCRKASGDENAIVSLFNGIMSLMISGSGGASSNRLRVSLFAINSEHLGDAEKRNESELWIAQQLTRVHQHLRAHFSATESEEFPVTLLRFSELLESTHQATSPIQLDASVPVDGILYRVIDAVLFSSHVTAAECSHVLITNGGDYYLSNVWSDVGNALRSSSDGNMKKVVVWSHSGGIDDKEEIISLSSASSLGKVLKHSSDFGAALIALPLYRERYKISYFGQGPPIDWKNTVWGLFDRIDRDVPDNEKEVVKRVTFVQQHCTL